MPMSFEEFAAQHGGDAVWHRGRYLFADGAQSNGHDHIAPPADPAQVIDLQIEFLKLKRTEHQQNAVQKLQPRPELEIDFTKRQNCPRVWSRERWLYENTAQWFGRFGAEPVADASERVRLELEYLRAALEHQERLFRECQTYIFTSSEYLRLGAGPGPDPAAFDDLEQFQQNVLTLRERLEAKEEERRQVLGISGAGSNEDRRNQERLAASQAVAKASQFQI